MLIIGKSLKKEIKLIMEEDCKEIINKIKKDIRKTHFKVIQNTNSEMILLYFRIGMYLSNRFKYGNKFIDQLSKELRITFPNIKGFSVRNLKYMKSFFLEYKDDKVVQRVVAQLPWRHNIVLISKLKDNKVRKIYAEAIIKNGWTKEELVLQIENNYHLRIGNSSNNFNKVLKNTSNKIINDIIKDPYIFDFLSIKEKYKEKELEEALIERIKDVLLELGKGFSFVGNQYKISTGSKDYYLDLLFYHINLKCYIVVELKIDEFKPEYIGQLGFYVKAVDKILKSESDNSTIGLLLCKEKDKLSVEWSLESINVPIGVSSFKTKNHISKKILDNLPTEEYLKNMLIYK